MSTLRRFTVKIANEMRCKGNSLGHHVLFPIAIHLTTKSIMATAVDHSFCMPCLRECGTRASLIQCPVCPTEDPHEYALDPYTNCAQCYDVLERDDAKSCRSCRTFFCEGCECPVCDAAEGSHSRAICDVWDLNANANDAALSVVDDDRLYAVFRPWHNVPSEVRMSSLAMAACEGDMDSVERLVESGALAVENTCSDVDHLSALEAAIFGQHMGVALYLLKRGPALSKYGPTALHMAAAAGSTDLVQILVRELGHHVDEERFGKTAIAFAMSSPLGVWRKMIPCLRGLGAEVRDADIKAALAGQNLEQVVALLDSGTCQATQSVYMAAYSLTTALPASSPVYSFIYQSLLRAREFDLLKQLCLRSDLPQVLETCAKEFLEGPIEKVLLDRPQFLDEFRLAGLFNQTWQTKPGFWKIDVLISNLAERGYGLDFTGVRKFLFQRPMEVPNNFTFN
ncbi:hypothetical protein B0T10DRAFT_548452 [Thelonectria olida]|uniref:Uncharacterized protein n=1 Tax=Thelonectria olida TaxID=1576542 RepID=A0A9P8W4H0_9HYPO|nr:hypothetical protein B0T10DRAFT_548452 [Thelonectria olida]